MCYMYNPVHKAVVGFKKQVITKVFCTVIAHFEDGDFTITRSMSEAAAVSPTF